MLFFFFLFLFFAFLHFSFPCLSGIWRDMRGGRSDKCDLWGFVVLKFCVLEFGYKGSRDEKMPKQNKEKKRSP